MASLEKDILLSQKCSDSVKTSLSSLFCQICMRLSGASPFDLSHSLGGANSRRFHFTHLPQALLAALAVAEAAEAEAWAIGDESPDAKTWG